MNKNFFSFNNKQYVPPRVYSVRTCSPVFTPDVSKYDVIQIYSLRVPVKFNNPSGTVFDFQGLRIVITGGGVHAITWDTKYKADGTALPSTTANAKALTMEFRWRSYDRSWHLISSSLEV